MSESNRQGDTFFAAEGQPMVTACPMAPERPMPPCAYCETESTLACDADGAGPWGRCGVRMCERHSTKVGNHHDLCREHATGDHLETIRRGDTAQNVWWEIVQTRAVPIPGTERPLSEADRISGVVDPTTSSTRPPAAAGIRARLALVLFGVPGRIGKLSRGLFNQRTMKPINNQPRVGNRLGIPRMAR
jgi:hypothetical protein